MLLNIRDFRGNLSRQGLTLLTSANTITPTGPVNRYEILEVKNLLVKSEHYATDNVICELIYSNSYFGLSLSKMVSCMRYLRFICIKICACLIYTGLCLNWNRRECLDTTEIQKQIHCTFETFSVIV